MDFNFEAIRDYAIRAKAQMDASAVEDVLRHMFSAQLPLMFPANPWWILEHSIGVEHDAHFIDAAGRARRGFVDSLVGKTAIEYEKNLAQRAIFDEGFYQVKEYCASSLNRGDNCADIIGVLSDTLRWFAFSVHIVARPTTEHGFGPENIALEQLDSVDLYSNASINEIEHFSRFIYKYLGREGSRRIMPVSLAADMGLDSVFYANHIAEFRTIVDDAFSSNPQYARMISDLWQSFVAYLGGTAERGFDRNTYVNEFYIITLAKLLCANILNGTALPISDAVLQAILDGHYFMERGFANLVEYDYFGWLTDTPYIQNLLPVARGMQHDLIAYDYTSVVAEDLFGPLVAQLADKDRRLLLGQEYTPQWLAQKIVAKVINDISADEAPNMVDMCCGSGVFIVEGLKQTAQKYNLAPQTCSAEQFRLLINSVVGFDIDPLAVMLAKINWVLAVRDYVPVTQTDIAIPVYHADSFFSNAPMTLIDPDYTTHSFRMVFDGETVLLPGFLITPENRSLFDLLIKRCYEIAKIRAHSTPVQYTLAESQQLVTHLVSEIGATLNANSIESLVDGCKSLIETLELLQRENRNGIWSFILGNSYRPGLVAGQFNAIISNPPWMATSKLADNPYKATLVRRSSEFGIKPGGSSHLHIELATIFLLNAVDKYLKPDAVFGCVMPSTLLNGYHQEPFRQQKYLYAEHGVDMSIQEIWNMPADTFKNKAIVVFGEKSEQRIQDALSGRRVSRDEADNPVTYRVVRQGRRSAWTDNPAANEVTNCAYNCINALFSQGADVMPRTLVFHKCLSQPNGKWSINPIPRQNDELSYLVSGGKIKKYKNFTLTAINIDDCFLFDCYESEHVLPFYVCAPAKALLPMKRVDGCFMGVSEAELATYGASVTAAFSRIFSESGENARQYFDRINCRNKLSPQFINNTDGERWLVLVGAGGGYTCGAYIAVSDLANADKTIIDQTLYWHLVSSEDEALYISGLMNSKSLDSIIADFQPEGAQGRRHVHKLPYNVTPQYDPENDAHVLVVMATRTLKDALHANIQANHALAAKLSPASSSLARRRRTVREYVQRMPEYEAYEDACRAVYGV